MCFLCWHMFVIGLTDVFVLLIALFSRVKL